jgi:3',5'-cyclic AMP phosphodiesterase CpdA
MIRAAWVTDLHLNFLDGAGVARFLSALEAERPDVVLVGGDIGEADSVADYLRTMADRLARPIYFVLGNHDFYRGAIPPVRAAVSALCRVEPRLTYLSQAGVTALTPTTGLVGHDGWGDARHGDFFGTFVELNDHLLIGGLAGLDKARLREALERLGDEAAAHLGSVLPDALARFEHVLLLTHVPPFREACCYRGRASDDNWAPFFTCKAVGDLLLETMRARPDRRLTVLCGHSHGAAEVRVLPNLLVLAGEVEYGAPRTQRVFTLE